MDAKSCCRFLGPDIEGTPQSAVRTGRAGKLEAGGGLQPAEASRPWPQSTPSIFDKILYILHSEAISTVARVPKIEDMFLKRFIPTILHVWY